MRNRVAYKVTYVTSFYDKRNTPIWIQNVQIRTGPIRTKKV
jgi:hypothetical protein